MLDSGETKSVKVGEELENVIEGTIEIGRGRGQTTGWMDIFKAWNFSKSQNEEVLGNGIVIISDETGPYWNL